LERGKEGGFAAETETECKDDSFVHTVVFFLEFVPIDVLW